MPHGSFFIFTSAPWNIITCNENWVPELADELEREFICCSPILLKFSCLFVVLESFQYDSMGLNLDSSTSNLVNLDYSFSES